MVEMLGYAPQVSESSKLPQKGVAAVLRLAAEGATVPFVARYRKEATGGLDEGQIRHILEEAGRLENLGKRRAAIEKQVAKQGQLSQALAKRLGAAASLEELEDLYLPFKTKRRTRAQKARDRGLEPLAQALWQSPAEPARAVAQAFVNAAGEVPDVEAALQGARDLCAERLADTPEVRQRFRQAFLRHASVRVSKTKEHRERVTKFDHQVGEVPRLGGLASHRWLACCRGEAEGVLQLRFQFDAEPLLHAQARRLPRARHPSWAEQTRVWLHDAAARLLVPAAKSDARRALDEKAKQEAVEIFAANVEQLLLAPPLGARPVLGIDPGQRTGCKCALLDASGKLLATEVLQLVQGEPHKARARRALEGFLRKQPKLVVAVGNGTHGRETLQFVGETLSAQGPSGAFCVSVNEAGASVYSASELARREFPELDVTFRGAVSIARRLQDPLAELVKVDPKSIGVGQYQHDMDATRLDRRLAEVVESCVSSVGIDLNTASAPLLCHVGGLGPKLAERIVAFRQERGPFSERRELLSVPGLGPKVYEQAAGFLRVRDGKQPLDATAVHPERYPLVQRIARRLSTPLPALLGDLAKLERLDLQAFVDEEVGELTLQDILAELARPGRDPRREFAPPAFAPGVTQLQDVRVGMRLSGVVTNVAAFGAFVDVGVHQDGLIHISRLAKGFVKDPSQVVRTGQHVRVEVLDVDCERRRISLARLAE